MTDDLDAAKAFLRFEDERFIVTSRLVGLYAGQEDREWFVVDTSAKPHRAEWDATEADARTRAAHLNRCTTVGWDDAGKCFVPEPDPL